MDGRGWGRRVGVVVVVAVSTWGSLGIANVLAESHHRRWRVPEELLQDGQLVEPSPILEVRFAYDADASPALSIKRLLIKHGYAPQREPLDAGYVLSLHSSAGDTLSSLTFRIPNRISNPPPRAGESAGPSSLVLRAMEFAVTVPMPQEVVTLRVADPQGLLLIERSLTDVPVKRQQRKFRSLPKESGDLSSSFLDLLMEEAEAATNSQATLDVTFIGDNYTAGDLALFQQDVDRVVTHLLTYEPYASRAGQVVFHSVDNTTVDLGCAHYPTMDRLITCNDAVVMSTVNDAGAPYDKIIVLVNDPAYGGSGGSVAVSYNGGWAPQVAVHEFGHTFGDLLDEYTLWGSNGSLDNVTHFNCYAGLPPASAWDGLVAPSDYAVGCNYPNWYRSSACSIMLNLDCPYFNGASQRQLNLKLDMYAATPTPSVTLSADPTLVGQAGSSDLSWTAENAANCTASGGWSGDKPASGSETVSLTVTASYTLTCLGSSSPVSQTVTVAVDAQPPTVTLTAPANDATVTGTVTVAASASDSQGVSRLDFYKDGGLMASDNTTPFSTSWNTSGESATAHTLSARAMDAAGNTGTSAPVTVTVAAAPAQDTQAPVVTITSPAGGSQVSGRVTVRASATDNVKVTRMYLYIDGSLKETSRYGTLSYTWKASSVTVKSGAHTMTAKAVDAAGNTGTVSITVFK